MKQEDLVNVLFSMHKFILSKLDHIKQYKKIRKLESEVTSKLANYMLSDNYNLQETLDNIFDYEYEHSNNKLIPELELSDNDDDIQILCELFIYRSHPKLKSIVDIFLENKKFRKAEKIKMLESLRDSFAGLFEVVDIDTDQGFVFIRDIFTGKEFKIVDIKLSTFPLNKVNKKYYYNRIITYEGISFGTGVNCTVLKDNKNLKSFLKIYKSNKYSDLLRCIILYDIFKKEKQFQRK